MTEVWRLWLKQPIHKSAQTSLSSWLSTGSWDSWLVERQTHDRKVASSNLSRGGGRIFFTRVNFVCWLLLSVRSTPMLLQWHVKDPSHSAKSADGRLHLNMHTPLTQRSLSELTMLLPRHSVGTIRKQAHWQSGNIQPQSSWLTEPLWTDLGLKSGISVCEQISTLKKKKSAVREWMIAYPPKFSQASKKATTEVCRWINNGECKWTGDMCKSPDSSCFCT